MVRFKNRYLVVEFIWKDGRLDETLNEVALLSVVRESIQQLFGEFGLGSALASFQVKYYNPVTNICVIRCSRDEHKQIWCALTLITEIRHRVVMIRMLRVTGTFALCKDSAAAANATALQAMQPNRAQAALLEQAQSRLEQMES